MLSPVTSMCLLVVSTFAQDYAVQEATSFQLNEQIKTGCEWLWLRPLNRSGLANRCNCSRTIVECINTRMTPRPAGYTTHGTGNEQRNQENEDFFLQIEDQRFQKLVSVTIHGNNLEQLPSRLFGPSVRHQHLKLLNLSANYFLHIHPHAFQNLHSVEILDLSDNELKLNNNVTEVFVPLYNLRELRLKKAFNYGYTRNKPEELWRNFQIALQKAKLNKLRVLSLEKNWLPSIPSQLGCLLPALEELYLGFNYIDDWSNVVVNRSCFRNLRLLDLRYNNVRNFGKDFQNFADQLPRATKIRLGYANLHCNCNSTQFIDWMKKTDRILDADDVICYTSCPRIYEGRLVTNISTGNGSQIHECLVCGSSQFYLSIISAIVLVLILTA